MRVKQDEITFTLEDSGEIRDFWNIIAFALDLQAIREKEGKACMTEDELKLANELYDLTKAK